MKTKIILIIICIILVLYGFFIRLLTVLTDDPAVLKIKNHLEMEISSSDIILYKDTHGGFHGDGEALVIFVPTAEQISKIETKWQKTPVESGIAPLIFQKEVYNGLELREYIPNMENGYWFYKNRNYVSDGFSFNFSFAIFDGEKVYYYELDT